jgi:hypothetical protein
MSARRSPAESRSRAVRELCRSFELGSGARQAISGTSRHNAGIGIKRRMAGQRGRPDRPDPRRGARTGSPSRPSVAPPRAARHRRSAAVLRLVKEAAGAGDPGLACPGAGRARHNASGDRTSMRSRRARAPSAPAPRRPAPDPGARIAARAPAWPRRFRRRARRTATPRRAGVAQGHRASLQHQPCGPTRPSTLKARRVAIAQQQTERQRIGQHQPSQLMRRRPRPAASRSISAASNHRRGEPSTPRTHVPTWCDRKNRVHFRADLTMATTRRAPASRGQTHASRAKIETPPCRPIPSVWRTRARTPTRRPQQ